MSKKRSNEQYIEQLKKINPNIEAIEEYINSKTKIKHKCKIDGYIWEAKPNHTLNGHGCKQCVLNNRSKKYSSDEYKVKVKSIHPNIDVVEDYKGINIKIKHFCNIHKKEWIASPNNVVNNKTGCPLCGVYKSKGEEKIKYFLDKYNVNYKQEYSFNDLRSSSNRKLRYDFAIFDDKGKLKFLIEYDGELHYRPSNKTKLHIQLFRDNLKSEYAKNNKIKLIRIPYWDFKNIEKIIKVNI